MINKKVLAFGASGSKNSINQKFAIFVANQIYENFEVIDLSNFKTPLYTVDEEKENGLPNSIENIYNSIKSADIIVISLAEHNGAYTAFFKNVFDWITRKELKFLTDKKIILTATAPGPRGGQSVLDAALERFPRHGATIIGHFVLPKFGENFDDKNGIVNPEFKQQFNEFITHLKSIQ